MSSYFQCIIPFNQLSYSYSYLFYNSSLVISHNSSAIDSSAENELGGFTDYRQTIYSDGSIYYNFPSIIKSLCKVDVTYFPFDIQTCKLQFGSWAHHGWDLNVTARNPQGDISHYISNGEWTIVGVPAVRHELIYGCCPQPYPDVTFYIQVCV